MKPNSIFKMDCLTFMQSLPESSVDMILTDPPYGVNFKTSFSKHKRIENDDYVNWKRLFPVWLHAMTRVMKPDAVLVCFAAGGSEKLIGQQATFFVKDYFHIIQTVVWDKVYAGLGWKYRNQYEIAIIASLNNKKYKFYDNSKKLTNILKEIPYQFKQLHDMEARDLLKNHPTPKPVNLLKRFLEIHTLPGDLVLDPFSGSGSTAVACIETGRNFLTCEIDDTYYNYAKNRIDRHLKKRQMKV